MDKEQNSIKANSTNESNAHAVDLFRQRKTKRLKMKFKKKRRKKFTNVSTNRKRYCNFRFSKEFSMSRSPRVYLYYNMHSLFTFLDGCLESSVVAIDKNCEIDYSDAESYTEQLFLRGPMTAPKYRQTTLWCQSEATHSNQFHDQVNFTNNSNRMADLTDSQKRPAKITRQGVTAFRSCLDSQRQTAKGFDNSEIVDSPRLECRRERRKSRPKPWKVPRSQTSLGDSLKTGEEGEDRDISVVSFGKDQGGKWVKTVKGIDDNSKSGSFKLNTVPGRIHQTISMIPKLAYNSHATAGEISSGFMNRGLDNASIKENSCDSSVNRFDDGICSGDYRLSDATIQVEQESREHYKDCDTTSPSNTTMIISDRSRCNAGCVKSLKKNNYSRLRCQRNSLSIEKQPERHISPDSWKSPIDFKPFQPINDTKMNQSRDLKTATSSSNSGTMHCFQMSMNNTRIYQKSPKVKRENAAKVKALVDSYARFLQKEGVMEGRPLLGNHNIGGEKNQQDIADTVTFVLEENGGYVTLRRPCQNESTPKPDDNIFNEKSHLGHTFVGASASPPKSRLGCSCDKLVNPVESKGFAQPTLSAMSKRAGPSKTSSKKKTGLGRMGSNKRLTDAFGFMAYTGEGSKKCLRRIVGRKLPDARKVHEYCSSIGGSSHQNAMRKGRTAFQDHHISRGMTNICRTTNGSLIYDEPFGIETKCARSSVLDAHTSISAQKEEVQITVHPIKDENPKRTWQTLDKEEGSLNVIRTGKRVSKKQNSKLKKDKDLSLATIKYNKIMYQPDNPLIVDVIQKTVRHHSESLRISGLNVSDNDTGNLDEGDISNTTEIANGTSGFRSNRSPSQMKSLHETGIDDASEFKNVISSKNVPAAFPNENKSFGVHTSVCHNEASIYVDGTMTSSWGSEEPNEPLHILWENTPEASKSNKGEDYFFSLGWPIDSKELGATSSCGHGHSSPVLTNSRIESSKSTMKGISDLTYTSLESLSKDSPNNDHKRVHLENITALSDSVLLYVRAGERSSIKRASDVDLVRRACSDCQNIGLHSMLPYKTKNSISEEKAVFVKTSSPEKPANNMSSKVMRGTMHMLSGKSVENGFDIKSRSLADIRECYEDNTKSKHSSRHAVNDNENDSKGKPNEKVYEIMIPLGKDQSPETPPKELSYLQDFTSDSSGLQGDMEEEFACSKKTEANGSFSFRSPSLSQDTTSPRSHSSFQKLLNFWEDQMIIKKKKKPQRKDEGTGKKGVSKNAQEKVSTISRKDEQCIVPEEKCSNSAKTNESLVCYAIDLGTTQDKNSSASPCKESIVAKAIKIISPDKSQSLDSPLTIIQKSPKQSTDNSDQRKTQPRLIRKLRRAKMIAKTDRVMLTGHRRIRGKGFSSMKNLRELKHTIMNAISASNSEIITHKPLGANCLPFFQTESKGITKSTNIKVKDNALDSHAENQVDYKTTCTSLNQQYVPLEMNCPDMHKCDANNALHSQATGLIRKKSVSKPDNLLYRSFSQSSVCVETLNGITYSSDLSLLSNKYSNVKRYSTRVKNKPPVSLRQDDAMFSSPCYVSIDAVAEANKSLVLDEIDIAYDSDEQGSSVVQYGCIREVKPVAESVVSLSPKPRYTPNSSSIVSYTECSRDNESLIGTKKNCLDSHATKCGLEKSSNKEDDTVLSFTKETKSIVALNEKKPHKTSQKKSSRPWRCTNVCSKADRTTLRSSPSINDDGNNVSNFRAISHASKKSCKSRFNERDKIKPRESNRQTHNPILQGHIVLSTTPHHSAKSEFSAKFCSGESTFLLKSDEKHAFSKNVKDENETSHKHSAFSRKKSDKIVTTTHEHMERKNKNPNDENTKCLGSNKRRNVNGSRQYLVSCQKSSLVDPTSEKESEEKMNEIDSFGADISNSTDGINQRKNNAPNKNVTKTSSSLNFTRDLTPSVTSGINSDFSNSQKSKTNREQNIASKNRNKSHAKKKQKEETIDIVIPKRSIVDEELHSDKKGIEKKVKEVEIVIGNDIPVQDFVNCFINGLKSHSNNMVQNPANSSVDDTAPKTENKIKSQTAKTIHVNKQTFHDIPEQKLSPMYDHQDPAIYICNNSALIGSNVANLPKKTYWPQNQTSLYPKQMASLYRKQQYRRDYRNPLMFDEYSRTLNNASCGKRSHISQQYETISEEKKCENGSINIPRKQFFIRRRQAQDPLGNTKRRSYHSHEKERPPCQSSGILHTTSATKESKSMLVSPSNILPHPLISSYQRSSILKSTDLKQDNSWQPRLLSLAKEQRQPNIIKSHTCARQDPNKSKLECANEVANEPIQNIQVFAPCSFSTVGKSVKLEVNKDDNHGYKYVQLSFKDVKSNEECHVIVEPKDKKTQLSPKVETKFGFVNVEFYPSNCNSAVTNCKAEKVHQDVNPECEDNKSGIYSDRNVMQRESQSSKEASSSPRVDNKSKPLYPQRPVTKTTPKMVSPGENVTTEINVKKYSPPRRSTLIVDDHNEEPNHSIVTTSARSPEKAICHVIKRHGRTVVPKVSLVHSKTQTEKGVFDQCKVVTSTKPVSTYKLSSHKPLRQSDEHFQRRQKSYRGRSSRRSLIKTILQCETPCVPIDNDPRWSQGLKGVSSRRSLSVADTSPSKTFKLRDISCHSPQSNANSRTTEDDSTVSRVIEASTPQNKHAHFKQRHFGSDYPMKCYEGTSEEDESLSTKTLGISYSDTSDLPETDFHFTVSPHESREMMTTSGNNLTNRPITSEGSNSNKYSCSTDSYRCSGRYDIGRVACNPCLFTTKADRKAVDNHHVFKGNRKECSHRVPPKQKMRRFFPLTNYIEAERRKYHTQERNIYHSKQSQTHFGNLDAHQFRQKRDSQTSPINKCNDYLKCNWNITSNIKKKDCGSQVLINDPPQSNNYLHGIRDRECANILRKREHVYQHPYYRPEYNFQQDEDCSYSPKPKPCERRTISSCEKPTVSLCKSDIPNQAHIVEKRSLPLLSPRSNRSDCSCHLDSMLSRNERHDFKAYEQEPCLEYMSSKLYRRGDNLERQLNKRMPCQYLDNGITRQYISDLDINQMYHQSNQTQETCLKTTSVKRPYQHGEKNHRPSSQSSNIHKMHGNDFCVDHGLPQQRYDTKSRKSYYEVNAHSPFKSELKHSNEAPVSRFSYSHCACEMCESRPGTVNHPRELGQQEYNKEVPLQPHNYMDGYTTSHQEQESTFCSCCRGDQPKYPKRTDVRQNAISNLVTTPQRGTSGSCGQTEGSSVPLNQHIDSSDLYAKCSVGRVQHALTQSTASPECVRVSPNSSQRRCNYCEMAMANDDQAQWPACAPRLNSCYPSRADSTPGKQIQSRDSSRPREIFRIVPRHSYDVDVLKSSAKIPRSHFANNPHSPEVNRLNEDIEIQKSDERPRWNDNFKYREPVHQTFFDGNPTPPKGPEDSGYDTPEVRFNNYKADHVEHKHVSFANDDVLQRQLSRLTQKRGSHFEIISNSGFDNQYDRKDNPCFTYGINDNNQEQAEGVEQCFSTGGSGLKSPSPLTVSDDICQSGSTDRQIFRTTMDDWDRDVMNNIRKRSN